MLYGTPSIFTIVTLLGLLPEQIETIYIYTDCQSKVYDVARRSKIVKSELNTPSGKCEFIDKRLRFINQNYKIVIKDYFDDYLELKELKLTEYPALKYGKNGHFEYFPKGSISASGSFIDFLYSFLQWDWYEYKLQKWQQANGIYSGFEQELYGGGEQFAGKPEEPKCRKVSTKIDEENEVWDFKVFINSPEESFEFQVAANDAGFHWWRGPDLQEIPFIYPWIKGLGIDGATGNIVLWGYSNSKRKIKTLEEALEFFAKVKKMKDKIELESK